MIKPDDVTIMSSYPLLSTCYCARHSAYMLHMYYLNHHNPNVCQFTDEKTEVHS